MIARIWRGWTRVADTDEDVRYVLKTGIKEYPETSGNRRALILYRQQGGRTEFLTLSFWDLLDSIREFAGDQVERAVFYPEDNRSLVDRETSVSHYEVVEVDAKVPKSYPIGSR
jgi:heme-degrading monooxygenase HmoA